MGCSYLDAICKVTGGRALTVKILLLALELVCGFPPNIGTNQRADHGSILTLKAPIRTAADDIHKYFFHCFSEKIRLDVSSESSA